MMFNARFNTYKLVDGRVKRAFLISMYGINTAKAITDDGEIVGVNLWGGVKPIQCEISMAENAKMYVFRDRLDYMYVNGVYSDEDVKKEWSRVLGEDKGIEVEEAKKWLDKRLEGTGYRTKVINADRDQLAIHGVVIQKIVEPNEVVRSLYLKGMLLGLSYFKMVRDPSVMLETRRCLKEKGMFVFSDKHKGRYFNKAKYEEFVQMLEDGSIKHDVQVYDMAAMTVTGIKDFWEDFQKVLVYREGKGR